MPERAVEASRDSLGAALEVAKRAGGLDPTVGAHLARGARDAFVSAMHAGTLVAAGAAALAAVIVAIWLPARERAVDPAPETGVDVHDEAPSGLNAAGATAGL